MNIRVCESISDRVFSEHYRLNKKCICSGDFFEIREVLSLRTQKKGAAKVYRKDELKDFVASKNNRVTGRDLVEHELKLFSKLDHPNILKVQEAYEDDSNIYFIIDEMLGGTLFDKIIREG